MYRHYYDWNYSISITSDEKRRGVGERRGEGDDDERVGRRGEGERVGERSECNGEDDGCNGEDDGVAVWLVVCDKLISWAIS